MYFNQQQVIIEPNQANVTVTTDLLKWLNAAVLLSILLLSDLFTSTQNYLHSDKAVRCYVQ